MKYTPEMILDLVVDVVDVAGIGVSTAAIAKSAGVSNGTLFNYFPTKQELIDALYVRLKLDLATALGDIDAELPLREQSQAVADRWFEWAVSNPSRNRVATLLHQSGLASESAIEVASAAFGSPARVLHDLAESGLMVDLPISYVSQLMQQHVELAVEVNLNPEQRATAFDALWYGITAGRRSLTSPTS